MVEAVRLRRQVEGGVVDEDGPGVGDDLPGVGHQALPLVGREQQYHKDRAVTHPEQHAEEVPVAGHADGVPVAGQADPGGEVAGIILGGPEAVLRHLDRREPEPLRSGRAVDVPVQPGVIREDLQAAADEQDDEQEVDVVGDAQPGRETVRLQCRLGAGVGVGWHQRQADRGPLDVRRSPQQGERRKEWQQCFQPDAHVHPHLLVLVEVISYLLETIPSGTSPQAARSLVRPRGRSRSTRPRRPLSAKALRRRV